MHETTNTPQATAPHTLHRADAIDTSVAAAHAVDSKDLQLLVLTEIRKHGEVGCTQDDVLLAYPTKPYSSITARFKALLDNGFIVDTGLRKPGRSGRSQRVVRAV